MISRIITCDTYEILAADPYPDGYDRTLEREQNEDARPATQGELPDQSRDDTVLNQLIP